MEYERKASLCTCKSLSKFCLLYFTTLLILTLIFTALNNEPKNAEQTKWWWAFIVLLLLTAAFTSASLISLYITDCYKVPYNEADVEQTPIVAPANDSQSASFKTVLTINSQPSGENTAGKDQDQQLNNFVNLTPTNKNVTVVDMKAKRKALKPSDLNSMQTFRTANPDPNASRLPTNADGMKTGAGISEPSNLAAVSSSNLIDTAETKNQNDKKRKKKFKKQQKNVKKTKS